MSCVLSVCSEEETETVALLTNPFSSGLNVIAVMSAIDHQLALNMCCLSYFSSVCADGSNCLLDFVIFKYETGIL